MPYAVAEGSPNSLRNGNADEPIDAYGLRAGYSGTGYLDFEEDTDESATFTVNVAEAGTYDLHIRFANGNQDRALNILVGGVVQHASVSFLSTGFQNWVTKAPLSLDLAAGDNQLTLAIAGDTNGPNIDAIAISTVGDAVVFPPANTPPQLVDPQATVTIEAGTSEVATFAVEDADEDAVTYVLSGADAALFTISATGVLSFVDAPGHTEGGQNTYEVVVSASDGELTDVETVTVTVTAPAGIDATITGESSVGEIAVIDAAIDALVYGDRDYTIAALPDALSDARLIRTNNDSVDRNSTAAEYLSFEATADGYVYVAYDTRATVLPAWLQSSWTATGETVTTLETFEGLSNQTFALYGRAVTAGETVTIGGADSENAGVAPGAGFSNLFVFVDDSDLLSALAEITLTAIDVDENVAGAIVADISVTNVDPAPADPAQFSLGGADADLFEVVGDATNGFRLKLVDSVELDFEAAVQPSVTVSLAGATSEVFAPSVANDPGDDPVVDAPIDATIVSENSYADIVVIDAALDAFVYGDRDYPLTGLPAALANARLIQTNNGGPGEAPIPAEQDRFSSAQSGYVVFTVDADGYVYVAYDARANSLPDWLETGWTGTGEQVTTLENFNGTLSTQTFNLYGRAVTAGETVDIGGADRAGSGASISNLFVFVDDSDLGVDTGAETGGETGGGTLTPGDDSFALPEDSIQVPLAVELNDPANTTITGFTDPDHGTLELIDGVLHYTPDPDYSNDEGSGADSFTYTIEDASGATGEATVSLTVTRSHEQPQSDIDNWDLQVGGNNPVADIPLTPEQRAAAEAQMQDLAPEISPSGLEMVVSRFAQLPGGSPSMLGWATLGDRMFVQAQDRGAPLDNNGIVYELVRNGDGSVSVVEFFDIGAAFNQLPVSLEGSSSFADAVRGFAFHPEFLNEGKEGYGKFYFSGRISREAGVDYDFVSEQSGAFGPDSAVIEFTYDFAAGAFDIGSYREVLRIGMGIPNKHPIKDIMFNPYAEEGDADYGNLYVINGDGAANESAISVVASQNNDAIGKLLRVNPLETADGASYSVPADNPFVGNPGMLDEVFAIGLRNEHDISFYQAPDGEVHIILTGVGYDHADEVNIVTPGANLGWALREGVWVPIQNGGNTTGLLPLPENDWELGLTYPASFVAHDPQGKGGLGNVGDVFQALAGGHVINNGSELDGHYIFGDFSQSSRIYHVPIADLLAAKTTLEEGEDPSALTWTTPAELTLLYNSDNDTSTTPIVQPSFKEIVNNFRSDIRFGEGPQGELYVMNKSDGWIYIVENSTPEGFQLPTGVSQVIDGPEAGPLLAENDFFATGKDTEILLLDDGSSRGLMQNDVFPGTEPSITSVNGTALNEPNGTGGLSGTVQGTNGGLFTIASGGALRFDPNGEFDFLGAQESMTTSVEYTITSSDGSSTSSATVVVTVKGDPASVPTIENFVENSPQPEMPSVGVVQTGSLVYADRDYTLSNFPDALFGAQLITTNNDDKDSTAADLMTFTLAADGFVYVGFDARGTVLPGWIDADWFETGEQILIDGFESNVETYNLYGKAYEAGETVTLGGNDNGTTGGESHYLVAVADIALFTPVEDPVDRAPTAQDGTALTDEDTAVAIDLSDLIADVEDGEPAVIAASSADGTVAIEGTTLTFTPNADFNGAATIAYTVEDSTGKQASGEVAVTIAAVNDAPVLTGTLDPAEVPATGGIIPLGGLTATDPENDPTTLGVRLATGEPAPAGVVINNEGALVLPDGLSAGPLELEIFASDGALESAPIAITVTIQDLIEEPPFMPIYIQGETAITTGTGTQVLTQTNQAVDGSGTDAFGLRPNYSGEGYLDFGSSTDGSESATYTFTSETAGTFDLHLRYASNSARQASLSDGSGTDTTISFPPTGDTATGFNIWGVATVSVTLTEGENTLRLELNGGNGPNIDVLAITEPGEAPDFAPRFTTLPDFTIEDGETAVGVIGATDVDGDMTDADTTVDAVTYAIAGGGDGAAFDIDPATGALSLNVPADFGTQQGYEVIVAVTDAGGAVVEQTITVAVDPNDPPELTGSLDPVELPGTGGVIELEGLTATDPEGDEITLGVRLAGGDPAPAGVEIDAAGDLVIPDGLTAGTLELEIFASDGELESAPVAITVAVGEPLDLSYAVPTAGELVIQLENRDGSVVINDTDIPGIGGINNSDLTQFRDSLNPELNSNGTVQEGNGKTGGLWDGKTGAGYLDMGGNIDDQATFDVTVEVAGAYTFAFRYNNGSDFNGGVRPLAIAVNGDTQTTPPFARAADWTTWLTETVTLTLPAGTSTISLTNTVENGPNIDQVTITPPDLSADADQTPLTLTGPAEDVAFDARDEIVLTVAGSDADIVTVEISFDGGVTRTDITADVDVAGNVTVDGSGLGAGAQTATIIVTDAAGNEASADVVLTIAAEAVNAAPVVEGDAYETPEDTALVIDVAELVSDDTDADADLTITAEATGGTVAVDGTVLTFTPDADFNGAATITYRATDLEGAVSADATLAVDVTAVDDAPTGVTLSPVAVAENAPGAVLADIVIGDADTVYDISGVTLSNAETFRVIGTPGALQLALAEGVELDFEAASQPSVTVTAGGVTSTPFVPAPENDPGDDIDPGVMVFDAGTLVSYSGQDRPDQGGAGASVSPDGNALTLSGNLWKRAPLTSSYAITEDTRLTVTIEIGALLSEIVAIGIDGDNDVFDNDENVYQLAGTQGQGAFIDLRGSGTQNPDGSVSFEIDLSAHAGTTISSLVFVADDDAIANGLGTVTFSGVALSEDVDAGGNTAPAVVGGGIADFTIDEGASIEVDLPFLDAEGDALTYSFTVTDAGGAQVQVDGLAVTDGVLTGPVPEVAGTYTVTVTANDGEFATSDSFTLTVNDVNDAPVSTDPTLEPFFGDVGTAIDGIELSQFAVYFTDADADDVLTITAEDLPAGLSVNAEGVIVGAPTVAGAFDVTIRATDLAGATATLTISLDIEGPEIGDAVVVEAEDFTGLAEASGFFASGQAGASDNQILRASSGGTAANITTDLSQNGLVEGWYVVSMTRYDETDGSAVYSLSVGDTVLAENALFDAGGTFDNALPRGIAGQAGNLKTITYDVPVFVSAGTVMTLSGTANGELLRVDKFEFTRVETPNDAPSATVIDAASIAENAEDIAIGTLSATDPDGDDASIVYSVDAASPFEIAGNVLRLKAGAAFDFETDGGTVDVVVRATDAEGASTETTLTIAITDVDEAPGAPVLAQPADVEENATGAVIGTLSAEDDSATLTFTVADPRFVVVNGNELALADDAALNFEEGTPVTVSVTVDDGTNQTTGDVSLTVADVNDAPVMPAEAAIGDVTLDANTGTTVDLAALGATDEDASDTVTYEIAGEAALAAGFVVEADGTTLTVPGSAPAGTYEVTVFATDGTADSESVSFTVTVGEPAPFAPFAVQGEDAAITLSATPDGDTTITFHRDQDDDSEDEEPGSDKILENGLRAGYSGNGYIDFGDDPGDTATFTFTVPTAGQYDLNIRYASQDAGGNPRVLDVAVNEGAAATTTFPSTGTDAPGAAGAGFNNWAFLTQTVTLVAGENTVSLAMAAGTSAGPNVDRIEITEAGTGPIPPANEAPAFAVDVPDAVSVAENTLDVGSFAATDADDDPVTYTLSGDDAAAFTIDAAGNLSFATEPDFEAPTDTGPDNVYNVTVEASDGTATTTTDVAVTVTDVDEGVTPFEQTIQLETRDGSVVIDDDTGGGTDNVNQTQIRDGENPESVNPERGPDGLWDDFTGGGYMDMGGNAGDAIEFEIDAPEAGDYVLTFRYGMASTTDDTRPMTIAATAGGNEVASGTLTFVNTTEWDNWQEEGITLSLAAGVNTIRLENTIDNGPNLDRVVITRDGAPVDDVTEPGPRETIRINFQDGTAPKAEGYLVANFDGYQERANGETYGFVTEASVYDADTASNTPIDGNRYPAVAINERSGTGENGGLDDGVNFDSFDPRLTGYAHTDLGSYPGAQDDPNERVAFELALENGWYEVTIAVGDTGGPNDSDNKLEIEGQLVADFVPTEDQKTRLVTAQVEVTDGNLTLAAPNGTITEFQYLDVRELPDLTPEDGNPATADYSTVVAPVAASGVGTTFAEVPLVQASGPVLGIDPTAAFTMGLDLADGRSGVLLESLNSGAIRLVETLTGDEVALTVNTSGGFDTLTISPLQPLKEFTSYNLIIDGLLDRGAVDDLDAPSREFLKSTFTFTTKELPEIVDREVAFNDTLEYRSNPNLGEVYTSIEISPDGTQLYTASLAGTLTRWDIDPVDGSIDTASQEVFFPAELNQDGGRRGIVGLVFDPEDPNTIWITDNYPVPLNGRDNGVPDFSGSVAKVTLGPDGSLENATYETYVTGLPRSNGDHVTNSLEFRNVGTAEDPEYKLYVIQGSNTAMGAPDGAWGLRPERLLNAAVMEIDHKRTGVPEGGFDVSTEPLPGDGLNRRFADDDNDLKNGGILIQNAQDSSLNGNYLHFDDRGVATVRTGIEADSTLVREYYDPFAEDAVVSIFATGQRNAYDLVWHSNGFLYTPTNGSASGGNAPDNPDTPQDESANNIERQDDYLFVIEEGSYSGHPNALRDQFILNGGNPTGGQDPNQVNKYPVGIAPEENYDPDRAYSLGPNRSPNGAIEYTADVFGANLKGAVIFVEYSNDNNLRAILLDENGLPIPGKDFALQRPDGSDIQSSDPLDVIQDAQGRLYVLTLERDSGTSNIIRLDPAPGGVVSDTTADEGSDLAISVNAADAEDATFTITGADADLVSLAVTFSDGTSEVTATATGNGTFAVDLSTLSGTVTATLDVADDNSNIATRTTTLTVGEAPASVFIDAIAFTVLSTLTGTAATVIRNINDPSTHEPGNTNDANGDGLNDGYDGAAYLDPNGGAEDKAAFTFDAPAAGTYTFTFRMANGSSDPRPISFVVGDETVTVANTNTSSFTNWVDFPVVLTLAAGANTIVINQPGGAGPNIDSVTITPLELVDVTADEGGDLDLVMTDLADPANAVFTISGADDDLVSATVSFTDGTTTVTETLAADGDFDGTYTVDLSSLSGVVTATLDVSDGPNTASDTAAFTLDDAGVPNDGTETVGGVEFTVYEAENAALSGTVDEVTTGEDDRGQSGGAFVDFDGTAQVSITWTIEVSQAGEYQVDFIYALATGKAPRPMELSVDDGPVQTVPFPANSNAGETIWGPSTISLDLAPGLHTLSLSAEGGASPNLDYLRVSSAPLSEPLDLDADEGDDLSLTVLDQTDAANVLFQVDGLDADIETLQVAFNGGAAGTVTVDENGQFSADTGITFGQIEAVLTVTDDAANTATAGAEFSVAPNGNANADIAVQSLDPGFYDDRLHFSFVNNSDGRLSKDTAQLEIANTGTEALDILDFTISEFYSVVEPATLTGASIAAGDSLVVTVQFDGSTGGANGFPSRSSNVNGVYEGVLTLVTNDAEDPFTDVDLAAFWQSQQESGQEPNINEVWQVLGFGNQIAGLPFAGGGENSILDFDDLWLPAPGQDGIEILSPYWRMADGVTEIKATIIAAYNASANAGLGIHAPGNKNADVNIATWGPSAQSQTLFPLKTNGDFATLTFGNGFIPDAWIGNDVFGIEMANLSTDPRLNPSGDGTPSQNALNNNYGTGTYTVTGTGANAVVTDAEGNVVEDGYTVRMFQALDANGVAIENVYLGIMDYTGINYDYNDNMFIIEGITPVGFGGEMVISGLDDAAADDRLVFTNIEQPNNAGGLQQNFRNEATFTISNNGFAAIDVDALSVSGGDAASFEIVSGPEGAFTIAAGAAVQVTIGFIGADGVNDNAAVLYNDAQLVVTPSEGAAQTIALAGVAQLQSENGEEPTVEQIVAALGYSTDVAQGQLAGGGVVETVGDEVLAPYFTALNGALPVEVIQVAAFLNQTNVARLSSHGLDNAALTELFAADDQQGQTVLPDGLVTGAGDTGAVAQASFSPDGPFGLKVTVDGRPTYASWTDPEINKIDPEFGQLVGDNQGHLIRFFQAKDAAGNDIPGTFIGIQDYPGAGNYDYNDHMFVIKNVQAYDPAGAEDANSNGVIDALETDSDTDGTVDFFDDAVTPPAGQNPFGGTAPVLDVSLTVGAVAYDDGGQGVAYNDDPGLDGGTNGGRTGSDVETFGGAIAFVQQGEWVEYTINVAEAGTYNLSVNAKAPTAGATVAVSLEGGAALTTITLPDANGAGNDSFDGTAFGDTAAQPITLAAGQQTLRFTFDGTVASNGYVLDFASFSLDKVEVDPSDVQEPFPGPDAPVLDTALTVDASNYDTGGQGVSYNDAAGLQGGSNGGRGDGDVEQTPAGDIGWIATGDWLEYTVNVGTAGLYDLGLLLSNGSASGSVVVDVYRPGEDTAYASSGPISNPNSGGWTTFVQRDGGAISLEAGEQVIRVTFTGSNDFRSFTLTQQVVDVNEAPTSNDIAGTTVTEGTAISLDVSGAFSDPDGDTLTYSVTGLDGLSISAAGVITGTAPQVGADTGYAVTVTASDGEFSISETFTLTVEDEPIVGPTQTPFPGPDAPVLADSLTVDATNFDAGGQGVSWNDNPGKEGGSAARPGTDVETVGSENDIGYVLPGEWVEYTIDVAEAGTFDLSVLAKAPTSGATVSVSLGDGPALTTFTLPDSNGAGDTSFSGTTFSPTDAQQIALGAGEQTLRFTFDGTTADNGFVLDMRSFTLDLAEVDPVGPEVIGEAGSVTFTQTGSNAWYSVTFEETLDNPSVVMGPISLNGVQQAVMKVRNVTDTGFEYQLDEWDYLDGGHTAETVSWLAVEQGVHQVGGQTIVAGAGTASDSLGSIGFGTDLGAAPVVLAQVASDNGNGAVVDRIDGVSGTGFDVLLNNEEAKSAAHGTEDLHWIAIETGGSAASGFMAGLTGNSVTHNTSSIGFGGSFADEFVFLADMQTENGGDPAAVRLAALSQISASVFIEEEASADSELTHISEVVGWAGISGGLLFADDTLL